VEETKRAIASAAGKTNGKESGKSKMGNSTSRERVWIVIEVTNTPTAT
jgi:hypothetical protein